MRLASRHLIIEPMSRAGIAAAQQHLPEELRPLCAACADALDNVDGDMLWYTGWLVFTQAKKPKIVGLLSLNGPPDAAHTVQLKGAFCPDAKRTYAEEAVLCFLKKWLWKQESAAYVRTSPAYLAADDPELPARMGFVQQQDGDFWERERPAGNFSLSFALLGCIAGVYMSTHFEVSILTAFLGTALGYAAGIPFEKRDAKARAK